MYEFDFSYNVVVQIVPKIGTLVNGEPKSGQKPSKLCHKVVVKLQPLKNVDFGFILQVSPSR